MGILDKLLGSDPEEAKKRKELKDKRLQERKEKMKKRREEMAQKREGRRAEMQNRKRHNKPAAEEIIEAHTDAIIEETTEIPQETNDRKDVIRSSRRNRK